MKWRELLQKVQNSQSPLAHDDSLPDDVTTDKRLRSLRRQMRREMEVEEKDYLEQAILSRQREREHKAFFGEKKILQENGITPIAKSVKKESYYGKTKFL